MPEIIVSGPLFDGRVPGIVGALVEEIQNEIAKEGVKRVKARLHTVLQHPTGYYESRVVQHNNVVTDSGVIYGPWLEGVSRRNQTTRFKGYATFRKVKQDLEADAVSIAEPVVARFVGRLQ